ncbi:oxysterol-binding protein-related protein 1-like isoform X3 [Apostichopus japonicus]|uniref:oxysterol-binding protein-related protein 1-like isoform X3 n=1 Tax=Stichopus japonicus TaxID=307972 RepID=UPI003AB72FF1
MYENMQDHDEGLTIKEKLLLAARNGDAKAVKDLILRRGSGEIELDVNCRGESKANKGWTPLHLAAYFGHVEVASLLLQAGCDVNALNSSGESPLHRAAYTNRTEIVRVLLEFNADVHILNCEGLTAQGLATDEEVKKMLAAIDRTQLVAREQQLLSAVAEKDMGKVLGLLRCRCPPDVNCVDSNGNTPLIRASLQDNRDMAVLLIQNGADVDIRNNSSETATSVAKSSQMKELLEIQGNTISRFEGPILKMFGLMHRYKSYWIVVDQGVATYYKTRADSVAKAKRRGYRYLSGSKIEASSSKMLAFTVHYPDGYSQVWKVDTDNALQISRDKWVKVFQDHSSFSGSQQSGLPLLELATDGGSDEISLTNLEEKIKNARVQQDLLEEHVKNIRSSLSTIIKKPGSPRRVIDGGIHKGTAQSMSDQIQKLLDLSETSCSTLRDCLNAIMKHDQLRATQLQQEKERSEAFEKALTNLAHEHHSLEEHLTSAALPLSPEFSSLTESISSDGQYGRSRASSYRSAISRDEYFSLAGSETSELSSDRSYGSLESVTFDEEGPNDTREAMSTVSGVETSTVNAQNNYANMKSDRLEVTHNEEDDVTEEIEKAVENVHLNGNNTKPGNGIGPEFVLKGCSRKKLPYSSNERGPVSLWTILKHSIGKDLSRITMPVDVNEPLSFLQRCSEYTEQAELLTLAGQADDPVDRMKYVAAFVVGSPASNMDRTNKPFNPLLGETYQLERTDLDVKMVLEQVSHHPPISAFHMSSPHFVYHGSVYPKLKFWGKNVELQTKGVLTVELPKYNEAYTWHSVDTAIHNIIVGKLWVEFFGHTEIVNHRTGHKCSLNFRPAGWFGRDLHKVDGYIIDKKGKKLRKVFGKWPEYFYCMPVDAGTESQNAETQGWGNFFISTSTSSPVDKMPRNLSEFVPEGKMDQAELVWKNKQRPEYAKDYYNFTNFTMQLNEIGEGIKEQLPVTDSRLRPDIRHLENGEIDNASSEKHRLEEKQRASRKNRNKTQAGWTPAWFKEGRNPHCGEMDWLFTEDYWNRDFAKCPDIF